MLGKASCLTIDRYNVLADEDHDTGKLKQLTPYTYVRPKNCGRPVFLLSRAPSRLYESMLANMTTSDLVSNRRSGCSYLGGDLVGQP